MKITGWTRAARLGGLMTAVTIGLAACGSSTSKTSAESSPAPSPAQILPAGCHGGVAHDVDSTLAILTDPSNCPGSVNKYWKEQLGALWTEPVFIPYYDGEIPNNACGKRDANPADFADNAFFCPADGTIAYSRDLLNDLYHRGGPYLPVVVLEHELGHRADKIASSVGVISRSEENEADCDAGVTTAYARTAHRLPLSDVFAAAKVLYDLGDTRNFGAEVALSSDAHGTPKQRVAAFTRGYFQSVKTCRTLGESQSGKVGIPGVDD
jgi:predicted metalloprotease